MPTILRMVRENRVATALTIALSLSLLSLCGCGRAATTGSPAAQAQPGDIHEAVAVSDLPAPVLAAARSHPRATLAGATKVTRSGNIVFYELQLTGTSKTHMVVGPDGQVLTFD